MALNAFINSVIPLLNHNIARTREAEKWTTKYPSSGDVHVNTAECLAELIETSTTRGQLLYWCVVLFSARGAQGSLSTGLSMIFRAMRDGSSFADALAREQNAKDWSREFENPAAFLNKECRARSLALPKSVQWEDEQLQQEYANAIRCPSAPRTAPAAPRTPRAQPATLVSSSEVLAAAKRAAPSSGRSYAGVVVTPVAASATNPRDFGDSENGRRVLGIVDSAPDGVNASALLDVMDERLALRDLSSLDKQFTVVTTLIGLGVPEMRSALQQAINTLAGSIDSCPTLRSLDEVSIQVNGRTVSAKKALLAAREQLSAAQTEMAKATLALDAAKAHSQLVIAAVTASGVLDEPAGVEAKALLNKLN